MLRRRWLISPQSRAARGTKCFNAATQSFHAHRGIGSRVSSLAKAGLCATPASQIQSKLSLGTPGPLRPGSQAPTPSLPQTEVSTGGTVSRKARSLDRPRPARQTRPGSPGAPPPPRESRASASTPVRCGRRQILRDEVMVDVEAVAVGAQEDQAAAAEEARGRPIAPARQEPRSAGRQAASGSASA